MTEGTCKLTFAWVDGIHTLKDIVEEWSSLAERVSSDIYTQPDWIMTWWTHFGQAKQLKSLIVRQADGRLVALIPFMIYSLRLGLMTVRAAKLAATDPNTVIFRLTAEDDALTPSLKRAFSDLLYGDERVHLISFTPASERGQVLKATREATALCHTQSTSESSLSLIDTSSGTHTVFELPETIDKYLSGLSKKRRNQYRRDLRRLQGDYGMTTSLSHPNAKDFGNFARFHNQQWYEIGKGGHFTDWPGSTDFYSDLAETTLQNRSTWFVEQHGHDSTLATQFCLVSGQVCHWRLPARSTDPELERLSLGKVGLIQMIETLIEAGVSRIEAGIGPYGYKLIYGGENIPTHRLIVSRQGFLPTIMVKLCLGWARILHLAYYRLWFGRIIPHLRSLIRLNHKPLWGAWIKTRL